jgi:arylsulfatase A-like enzyme
MRAIMVMYDSLNRRMLEPYGCDWVHTPNFRRLAERAVTFDRAYVGSMPCMPARRELHTGRYNFLHRSWGPIEPFDDSVPQILKEAGVQTHLASDHYHYWEEGGATYHTKYSTWETFRGHEGDPWIGQVKDPVIPPSVGDRGGESWRQDWVNREHMPTPEDQPQHMTMSAGMDYLRRNADQDNWFLHIETFDPHEPYFTHEKYKKQYPHKYDGKHFDWPSYGKVTETPEEVEHCRLESAANHSMCDDYLGRVLDVMDELDLWDDTMLIVNTDHGFLLSEHDFWAKCSMPFYNEVANMPLFVWDPRSKKQNEHRQSLVQTIDLPATLLDYFDVDLPADMQGVPLRDTIESDAPVREAGLFGIHGGQVNVTDGRYVYMRGPVSSNQPLYNYTVMPTHMRGPFSIDEMRTATLAEPFEFTKGTPTLRIDSARPAQADGLKGEIAETRLYDLENDPLQEHPIDDPEVEKMMIAHLERLMRENNAPTEQFERLGL